MSAESEALRVDGIVVPGGVLRGFRNAGEEESVLLTVLGAHGTGACVWSRALRNRFVEARGAGR